MPGFLRLLNGIKPSKKAEISSPAQKVHHPSTNTHDSFDKPPDFFDEQPNIIDESMFRGPNLM